MIRNNFPEKDCYETLGVSPSATQAEIKAAWRRLSKKYHLDRGGSALDQEKLKVINEAYECLKTEEKRREWDSEREAREKRGGSMHPPRPSVSPSVLDFGSLKRGETRTKTVTLRNTGGPVSDSINFYFAKDPSNFGIHLRGATDFPLHFDVRFESSALPAGHRYSDSLFFSLDGASVEVPLSASVAPAAKPAKVHGYSPSSGTGRPHSTPAAPAPFAPGLTWKKAGGFAAAVLLLYSFSKLFSLGKEAPPYIVDRDYTGYVSMWKTVRDGVPIYEAPPAALGIPESALKPVAVLNIGQWVRTGDYVTIAHRREVTVSEHTHYGILRYEDGVPLNATGPRLKVGQKIPAYYYMGDSCWRVWIDGEPSVLCGPETNDSSGDNEWWVQVKTKDGVVGWVDGHKGDFTSQESLNSALAQAIYDEKASLREKLPLIDSLIKAEANLNGTCGIHCMAPYEAVMFRKDPELVMALIGRGFLLNPVDSGKLRNSEDQANKIVCPAWAASSFALSKGGSEFLEFLLENGMKLDCLPRPPLHMFLLQGTGTDDYPVLQAMEVAKVLLKHGADVEDLDPDGKSIFQALDNAKDKARIAPLRELLAANKTFQ